MPTVITMTTAIDLISRGYFPREVPPPFTTTPLGELFDADASLFAEAGSDTECAPHNLARTGGLRRALKIPNPQGYVALAQVIEGHWPEIDAHLKASRISLSRPVPDVNRALIPRFRIKESATKRAQLWSGQRFVLRTDVSQFYSTLYTHSVPWALHGKAFAKRNRHGNAGADIDKAMRRISDGQTSGIPIGPDPSFVVAEVVLTAVDRALAEQLPNLRGFRQADDFEAAFASRAAAEMALVALEGLLGDFELMLNPFKTRILELPQPLNDTWPADLTNFPLRMEQDRPLMDDLISLFSRAFEVKTQRPQAGALKYVLQRCRDVPVRKKWWPTYQALVLSTVSAEPTTMPVAIDLLRVKAAELGEPLDLDVVGQAIEGQILHNAPMRNGGEVAWALWASILLEIPLTEAAAQAVVQVDDNLVALLALDAESKGRFPNPLDKDNWQEAIGTGDALSGQHWLLAYEASVKGWLDAAVPEVEADPFFSMLNDNDVYFYEVDRDWIPFRGPAAPLPGGVLPESSL